MVVKYTSLLYLCRWQKASHIYSKLKLLYFLCTDIVDVKSRHVDAKAERPGRQTLLGHITSLEKFATSNDVDATIVTSTCVKLSMPQI